MPRKRSPSPDFLAVLRILARRQVDFIVVGGVCAALHGAPVTTFDLDVVHSRDPDNIERLLSALDDLEACCRMAPERKLKPNVTYFAPFSSLGELGPLHLCLGNVAPLPQTALG
ncbi:MAG: hypothetical protein AAB225_06085 [Acidobacteriota bacterium]